MIGCVWAIMTFPSSPGVQCTSVNRINGFMDK